jgi:hypothetical protein
LLLSLYKEICCVVETCNLTILCLWFFQFNRKNIYHADRDCCHMSITSSNKQRRHENACGVGLGERILNFPNLSDYPFLMQPCSVLFLWYVLRFWAVKVDTPYVMPQEAQWRKPPVPHCSAGIAAIFTTIDNLLKSSI